MNFASTPEFRVFRFFNFFKAKAVLLGWIALAAAVGSVACKRLPTAEQALSNNVPVRQAPVALAPLIHLDVRPVADQLIIEEVPVAQSNAAAKRSDKVLQQLAHAAPVVVHQSVSVQGKVTSIRTKSVTVSM